MAKVSYQHTDEDATFAFNRADGSLVEITASSKYTTDDPAEIAYLDTVRFVKRATKSAGGKEA